MEGETHLRTLDDSNVTEMVTCENTHRHIPCLLWLFFGTLLVFALVVFEKYSNGGEVARK